LRGEMGLAKCPICGTDNKSNARFCNECAYMLKGEIKGLGTLGTGVILGKYHVVKPVSFELGEALYKVEDRENECFRYAKEILTAVTEEKLQLMNIKNFEREMEIIEKIKSPYFPKIKDSFTERGNFYLAYYIIFDYVEGVNLNNISKEKPLEEDFIISIARQLCDAISAFHNSLPPLFCFNLSPSNVLLKQDGNILLTDIPVSRKTIPQMVEFMAPERFEGKPEKSSDVFALGALMHNLLTGIKSTPFIFKPLKSVRTGLSEELQEIISQSLRLKADKRFENIIHMKQALDKITTKLHLIPEIKIEKLKEEKQIFQKKVRTTDLPYTQETRKILPPQKTKNSVIKEITPSEIINAEDKENLDSEFLHWYFQTEDKVSSSPVIAGDSLYIGSDDKHIYAININDGKEKWKFKTGSWVSTTPAFYNNKLYIGSRDGKIYCLNAFNGKKEWEYYREESIFFNPSIEKGNLLIGASLYKTGNYEEILLNLDPETGEEKWNFRTDSSLYAAPFIFNNIVYLGSEGGNIYALNMENGKEIWKFEIGGRVYSSPVIFEDILYVTCEGVFKNGIIHLLNADDGRHIWEIAFEKPFRSSVYVAEDMVYAASLDKKIYAIDLTEKNIKWTFETTDGIRTRPLLYESVIYLGSDDGILYALDGMTGKKLWHYKTGGSIRSDPAGAENYIFFGSRDGKVYSLKTKEEPKKKLISSELKSEKKVIEIKKEEKGDSVNLLEEAEKEKKENPQKALEIYRKLLDTDRNNPEILLYMANLYFHISDWEKAVSYYDKTSETIMSQDDLLKYANVLIKENRETRAEEILEKIEVMEVKKDKVDISTLVSLADLYLSIEKIDKAIENYERATQISVTPEIYIKLGKAYSLKGDLEESSLAYDLALELDDKYIDAILGKIQLLIIQKNFSEAMTLIKKGEEISEEENYTKKLMERKAKILLELGNESLEKNELGQTTKYFEEAGKLALSQHQKEILKKGQAHVFFKLAEKYSNEKKMDLAIKFYKMCEEIYPESDIASLARKKRKFRE